MKVVFLDPDTVAKFDKKLTDQNNSIFICKASTHDENAKPKPWRFMDIVQTLAQYRVKSFCKELSQYCEKSFCKEPSQGELYVLRIIKLFTLVTYILLRLCLFATYHICKFNLLLACAICIFMEQRC